MATPAASSPESRRRMTSQKRRDTAPELALRRALHAAGLRFRVDLAPVPGLRRRADIVFGPARVAVYVDGCFWHSCPQHGTAPRANADWWSQKLQKNRERDGDTDRRLMAENWLPIRVWEHEETTLASQRIQEKVRSRRPVPSVGAIPDKRPPGPRASQGRAVRLCP
jgi:DNA mismatch endonuclease (patch repair protein)